MSRASLVSYIGISVAIITICSWVTIPIGPIPITLQMFAIPLLICILPSRCSVAAVCAFLLIGCLGVPVFSGFRGGIGVLLGPTGGYLLGYIPGTILGATIMGFARKRFEDRRGVLVAFEVLAGISFTIVAYATGWIQYANVAGISLEASFWVSVAPFVIPDLVKVLVAVGCAQPVAVAMRRTARTR